MLATLPPIFKNGAVIPNNTTKLWQTRFNDTMRALHSINLVDESTPREAKIRLLAKYLENVDFNQFDCYDQCCNRSRHIASRLAPNNPQLQDAIYRKILNTVSMKFYIYARIIKMPLSPVRPALNYLEIKNLLDEDNSDQAKTPHLKYRLDEMFDTFSKNRNCIRTNYIFKKLFTNPGVTNNFKNSSATTVFFPPLHKEKTINTDIQPETASNESSDLHNLAKIASNLMYM
jgi:hypothetical protein